MRFPHHLPWCHSQQINSGSFNPKRHQLNKFVWPRLRVRALPAFQLIQNMTLSRQEFEKLSQKATAEAQRRKIDILKTVGLGKEGGGFWIS